MIKDDFAFIANYLWQRSIKNLNMQLTEAEIRRFNSNDYYYLTTIYHLGKPNFSQVAEALNFTKPAISAMIGKLIKMELIEKEQSQEDRRIYYISLTSKGKQIVEGDEALYAEFDSLIRRLLPNDEQYGFVDGLLSQIVSEIKAK
ncbi:MAG: transcriptional regulator, MarR/EmrR family protein [Clostridia bacterium]|jgi:DNA-binding MarR family transcriptional regulator|nr:transcriptional regulator, MarR/EmrR family protein [Clostridia bacterium]